MIARVYEVDLLECPHCHSPMKAIAVITEPEEIKNILRHLVKADRPPPGLDQSFVQLPICLLRFGSGGLERPSTA